MSELTKTSVGFDRQGAPAHLLISLGSPELFRCPFIMMTEVGALDLDDGEAKGLREYLLKGGFLWADDFWGTRAWELFETQMRKVLPSSAYQIVDLPIDHPIFHALMAVDHIPQIPSIDAWGGPEAGPRSAAPTARRPMRAPFWTITAASWSSSRTTRTSATHSSAKATAANISCSSRFLAMPSASTSSYTRCRIETRASCVTRDELVAPELTVTCTATDRAGNARATTFTYWCWTSEHPSIAQTIRAPLAAADTWRAPGLAARAPHLEPRAPLWGRVGGLGSADSARGRVRHRVGALTCAGAPTRRKPIAIARVARNSACSQA